MRVRIIVRLLTVLLILKLKFAIATDDYKDKSEILRDSFGSILKRTGTLIVSPHILTLNFMVKFDFANYTNTELPEALFEICKNENVTNKFVNIVCKHQLPTLIDQVNATNSWETKLAKLHQDFLTLADSPTKTPPGVKSRRKRGAIVGAVGFLIKNRHFNID